MDPQMRRRAVDRGVAAECCDAHRSRPLSAEIVEETDLILTMEKRHRNAVLDAFPAALGRVLMLGQAAQAAQQVLDTGACPQAGAAGLKCLNFTFTVPKNFAEFANRTEPENCALECIYRALNLKAVPGVKRTPDRPKF